MVVVGNPAGRLVTFRVVPPVDEGNAARAAMELRAVIVPIRGPVVICADLRVGRTFSSATTKQFVALMKSDNTKLERGAWLVGDESAVLTMQRERMLREADNPSRRLFFDSKALSEWLNPVLSRDEKIALDAFLAPGAI